MKLARKGTHRGVIGVESAIVMIAFVIVAAALAFVVLNMGFTTTQKAKTSIISGLGEASSSLQVAGKVTGVGCTTSAGGCSTTAYLNATAVPIKIASGGDSINLETSSVAIKYLSNTVEYDNIYQCAITSANQGGLSTAFTTAQSDSNCNSVFSTGYHPITGAVPTSTKAIMYWTVGAGNSILDEGEHAVLAIAYKSADRPQALDKIRAEVLLPTGAALSVERQVPAITNQVVDMG